MSSHAPRVNLVLHESETDMEREYLNILKSSALGTQDIGPEREAMPQTIQQLAALCLQQTPERLLSKEDKKHLFSMESWPQDLPIKTKDKLHALKIFNRVREALGL